MILSALLAVAIVAAPALEPLAAPETAPPSGPAAATALAPPPASAPSRLDVPISLNLKDASVVDVLEKLADLLGVTPILDPRLGGTFSVEVRNLPVSRAIEVIEKAARIEISVSAKVLRARTRGGPAGAATSPAPAPRASDPARLGEVVRFWLDGEAKPPVAVRVPGSVGLVDLPGCAGPVTVGRLGAIGGPIVGVALASAETTVASPKARILGEAAVDGTRVNLPGCDGRLLAEVGDPLPGATPIEPVRVPKGETLVITMRLLELTEEKEEELAAPRVLFRADAGFSVKSGFTADAPGGFDQVAEIQAVPLELRVGEESVLLAVFAAVSRTRATANAGPALIARRAESFWLKKDKPLRWTVDSSWDGGRAAIVLELSFGGRSGSSPR